MTDSGTTQSRTKRRWLLVALGVSLALNLLVVGVVIGARLHGPPPGAMLSNPAFSVGRAVRQFPEARRSELWSLAKPHFREMRPELKKLRGARHRWERAYQANPIDLEELDASQAQLSAQVAALQQMNFNAIKALGAELTPTERSELLSALRSSRGHRDHDKRSTRKPERPRSKRDDGVGGVD